MLYHYVPDGTTDAACQLAGTGTVEDGDQLVSAAEVDQKHGRWFNCRPCLDTLSGGQRHVPPPNGWTNDQEGPADGDDVPVG